MLRKFRPEGPDVAYGQILTSRLWVGIWFKLQEKRGGELTCAFLPDIPAATATITGAIQTYCRWNLTQICCVDLAYPYLGLPCDRHDRALLPPGIVRLDEGSFV